MRHFFYHTLLGICAVTLLSSCEHDEPVNPIKTREDRTLLVLTSDGKVYDQTGQVLEVLPDCTYASEIISEGDDYFVAGVSSKGRVGYWKNGKWNTLHVDFIEDVDHWMYGIDKWDSYIYLLDMPNVLKNSGIFPLKDSQLFIPADHTLRVSEGKCYVIGYELTDVETVFHPVIYTNYKSYFKKEYLPLPPGYTTGECWSIYASNGNHTVIGGIVGREPAVWVDKQCQIYQVSSPELLEDGVYPVGRIVAITESNGHIYAAGFEYNSDIELMATVWTDGVPAHYRYNADYDGSSQAFGIYCYGNDVYVLTTEYDPKKEDLMTHIWLNEEILVSYRGIQAVGLTIL